MSDEGSEKRKVRAHKRNQWYPSLKGHKEIEIEAHESSAPTPIWRLVNRETGTVLVENTDHLALEEVLARMEETERRKWKIERGYRSTARTKQTLNLIGRDALPTKAEGKCRKSIACDGPETAEGETCPACGCQFGRKRFRDQKGDGS